MSYLIHAALTTADRVTALARRKELYEARYPETRHGANHPVNARWDKSPQNEDTNNRPLSFVADTARKTGAAPKTVERDVRIGQAFTEEEIARMEEAKLPALPFAPRLAPHFPRHESASPCAFFGRRGDSHRSAQFPFQIHRPV